MTDQPSPRRRREVIDALRRGTVPANGLDLLAVGLERFTPALDAELDAVAGGGAAFKAVRGEYGSGKTFLTRYVAERALRSGFATAAVTGSRRRYRVGPALSATMNSESGLDRLHPVIVHHLINTLGWRSLRPLQEAAVGPVLDGQDALLLAPTAGGKTEAAIFPLLTAMDRQRWDGLSVIYVCPLKALLNNLLPRLESYAGWLGRRVGLWHGDTTGYGRRTMLTTPPDVLLTTPESLESMLVSAHVDHRRLFASLRAVVVDEVHAFGGDDRGWHLLAVLERIARISGGAIQRIGLSATVGNPGELLHWLQGSAVGTRPGMVVAPETDRSGEGDGPGISEKINVDIQLDYVGTVENAATVIAALYAGEKRLVFCDSKRLVEQLGALLRERGVTTCLSRASLSLDERRRAERAFAEGRDCVIVSASALELGLDVGDLDRVIQINAPLAVAGFLQRLGRSGRRPGTRRNCLFLALRSDDLLLAAGLLLAWSRGFIEPVAAPPESRHIVAPATAGAVPAGGPGRVADLAGVAAVARAA